MDGLSDRGSIPLSSIGTRKSELGNKFGFARYNGLSYPNTGKRNLNPDQTAKMNSSAGPPLFMANDKYPALGITVSIRPMMSVSNVFPVS